jgi:hypothetical protein
MLLLDHSNVAYYNSDTSFSAIEQKEVKHGDTEARRELRNHV